MVSFKLTEGNGCGSDDRSRRQGPRSHDRPPWMPNFEGEELAEGMSFNMDLINKTVEVEWSRLMINYPDSL